MTVRLFGIADGGYETITSRLVSEDKCDNVFKNSCRWMLVSVNITLYESR